MKKMKKGFTIVELVIVIAVIAILAGVLIPTFAGVTEKAKESKALTAATNAVTEYLAADNDHITNRKELIVDTGDYIVLVNVENEKTVVKQADLTTEQQGAYESAGTFENCVVYEKKA